MRLDPALAALPIETAHRDNEPALFERAQIYRVVDDGSGRPARSATPDRHTCAPRRFRLTVDPAAPSDLDVIALEHTLIRWVTALASASSPTSGDRPTEPLIHVAGHDPVIPVDLIDPHDRAHVVLSGCNSLPTSLPPGVASAVGTLWAVDDRSSTSMMAAYHGRLATGIGPVEALRQAQLLHRHQPAAAWAAYAHIGAPV